MGVKIGHRFNHHAAGPVVQAGEQHNKGFSLFELLLVLLLMGILAGIAMPATGKILDSLAFRKKASNISAVLRYARIMAISKGKEVLLTRSEDDLHALQLSGPVDEIKNLGFDTEDQLFMEPEALVFLPEGHATPAVITYVSGKRKQIIRVDPLTGMPELE